MSTFARLANYLRFSFLDSAHFGGSYTERERFNGAVFISPKRDFLFVKNEKCASNTARMTLQRLAAGKPLPAKFRDANRWMAPMLQPSDMKLSRIADLDRLIPFKFAIVRNPYTRLLSCYLSKFSGGRTKRNLAARIGTDRRLSFDDFVARIASQNPQEMDPHWRVQYFNIYCDLLNYDRFVKFENCENEFGALMLRFFGTSASHDVRKGAQHAELRLADHYTEETVARVRAVYARDFEAFGYSSDLPA